MKTINFENVAKTTPRSDVSDKSFLYHRSNEPGGCDWDNMTPNEKITFLDLLRSSSIRLDDPVFRSSSMCLETLCWGAGDPGIVFGANITLRGSDGSCQARHVGLLGCQTLRFLFATVHFLHCFLSMQVMSVADFCQQCQVILGCRCFIRASSAADALHCIGERCLYRIHTPSYLMKSLSCLVFRFDSIISGSGSQLVASDICISNIHTKIVSLFCVPGGLEQTQKSTYQAKLEFHSLILAALASITRVGSSALQVPRPEVYETLLPTSMVPCCHGNIQHVWSQRWGAQSLLRCPG